MTSHTDHYAPPQANLVRTDDEGARQELLAHEASMRSGGALYVLNASILLLISVAVAGDRSVGPIGGVYVVLGVVQFIVGVGMLRLDPRTRIPVGIISGLSLLGFPIGTLLHGYILWLYFSEKGQRVLTPEYLALVERTPHIRYKSSPVVVALGVILLALVALGVAAALMS